MELDRHLLEWVTTFGANFEGVLKIKSCLPIFINEKWQAPIVPFAHEFVFENGTFT